MPKIDEIEGRVEDVIIGKDGQKMVRFHGLFVDVQGLKAAQVVQNSLENIEIKLVIDFEFSKNKEKLILNRLTSQLGKVNVKFTYLNEIPKNNNGKYQAVISKLDKQKI